MPRLSYSRAGVDLKKVRGIHEVLATVLGATFANRKGLKGAPLIPIGHYAGLIDLGGEALALHTDGVGTKVLVAQQLRRFSTVGIDCVAMTVNDLVCMGAEPLALVDYIALQREDHSLVRELMKGLVEGARLAGVAIVGGETAVLGDVITGVAGKGFDLACMGVGLVPKEMILDGRCVEAGDVVVGVESSGLHSNGYTLARRVFGRGGLSGEVPGMGSTVGEALLTPTRVYVRPALSALRTCEVHGMGHITGGAFTKLTRLSGDRELKFDLTIPRPPPIFQLIRSEGGISEAEMYRTFNMGIGLCLVVPDSERRRAARPFEKEGFRTHFVGTVKKGRGVSVNGAQIA